MKFKWEEIAFISFYNIYTTVYTIQLLNIFYDCVPISIFYKN